MRRLILVALPMLMTTIALPLTSAAQDVDLPVSPRAERTFYEASESIGIDLPLDYRLVYAYVQLVYETPYVVGEIENVSDKRSSVPTFELRALDGNGDVLVDGSVSVLDGAADPGERVPFYTSLNLPRTSGVEDIAGYDIVTCGEELSGSPDDFPVTTLEDVEAVNDAGQVYVGGRLVAGDQRVETSITINAAAYRADGLYLGYGSDYLSTPLDPGQAYTLDISMPLYTDLDEQAIGDPATVSAWVDSPGIYQYPCDDQPIALPIIDPVTGDLIATPAV